MNNYAKDVIGRGDEVSGSFLEACTKANKTTENSQFLGDNGRITIPKKVESITESIDGVGTKMQIYNNIIESLIQEFKKENNTEEGYNELIEEVTEIYERMLHDLVAMNSDDLRNGEMAVAVTNIIDINHLKGIRGKVFSDAMSKALENTIKETGIMMTAGETAVLGEAPKFLETIQNLLKTRKELLEKIRDGKITGEVVKIIKKQIKEKREEVFASMRKLEFNIGGTGLGFSPENEKLVEMKPGQKIVYFSEKPTENGIIGPRSNGITRIRELIHNLAGKDWENLTFEEFLNKIGKEKANKIPSKLKVELKGLKMWNIATGKTTIFNPFISKKLLGGIDGEPIADISSLIHITGNPLHKMASGIKNENLMAEIDMTDIKIPQIIELLQYIGEITDEDAMSSWNMGTPYAIVCEADDVEEVIEKAEENGFIAKDIGEVKEKGENSPKLSIKGVGINNSEVVKK